jgi:dihydrofolate synthase/folylpolyglutamate synthase
MNYDQVLDYMFNSLPMYQRVGQAAYKEGLDNTLDLDKYFGHPHHSFKTIHVAGTNGKGSVSHSIASILQEAGYKTGLYTSPHLIDYRERTRVNGAMISEDYITRFINESIKKLNEIKPSFFEMSVALAFDYFRFSEVDIAVIEVGMGGRLDSTNIIKPELSIITNIGLDHTQFLGDSLGQIAYEKAGIIKPTIPVIIGETHQETELVFRQKAAESNTEITFADKHYNSQLISQNYNFGDFIVKSKSGTKNLNFSLSGIYQEKNLVTILHSIDKLKNIGFNISDINIVNGLKKVQQNTGLRGRWEIINQQPLTICDTGHNKEGLSYVLQQISRQEFERLHMVIGFVNDKNISEVLRLFPKDAEYYFTQASIPRAMASESVKIEAEKYGLKGENFNNVKSAYESAFKNASKKDMIFIGGSTFVVGDILSNI